MKNIFFMMFCFMVTAPGYGQDQFFTRTGVVSFKAGTSVEDVDGVNKSVSSIIDIRSGKIEIAMLIKGFEFKRGLMQEHFNENYMESDKFPKSTFKGKIAEVPGIDLSLNGVYKVNVPGVLEIHNVRKEVSISGIIKVENDVIIVNGDFEIIPANFQIEIPSTVRDKIAKNVVIHFNGQYKHLKKNGGA